MFSPGMDSGYGRGGRAFPPSARGRGQRNAFFRGRGQNSAIIRYGDNQGSSQYSKQSNTLAQYGNKRLIAKNLCDYDITEEDYKEFQIYKNQGLDKSAPSFKKIVKETLDEKAKMVKSPEERKIILLQNSDKKWEDNPWLLYNRYLIDNQYPTETYKGRMFYENILSDNHCVITHFVSIEGKEYNFSKINIKRIISIEEWGITPSTIKTWISEDGRSRIDYNYWDYIQAFDKIFLYENKSKTHTWLIKIYPEIFDQILPTWLIEWWQFYGTNEEILPKIFNDLFNEWKVLIPKTQEDDIPGIIQMNFFIEFSIPWIWKFIPKTGYTDNKLFCLKRESFTRFWDSMLRQNKETNELHCIYTINLIQDKIDSYTIFGLEDTQEIKEEDFDLENKSEEEIVRHFSDLAQKALKQKAISKYMDDDRSQKSDSSMATSMASSSQNKFAILQEGQDIEEDTEVQKMIEDDIKNNRLIVDNDREKIKAKAKGKLEE